jgi:hypothetical protein
MDLGILKTLNKEEHESYLEFLLWHYRLVDAFWFLSVAERFDQETAERINERVWARVPQMGAKDLMARFGIHEKGLKGFVKVLQYFPWTILVGYEFEENEDEVIVTVPS